jgi:catechol 2,3-dioxygenase-like lactoylglutathione lyase family enzyme
MTIRVQGLDHVAFSVGDQQRSARWYRELLGLERKYADAWGDTPVAVMSEGNGLALFKSSERRPVGFRHLAFRVDQENFERAQVELREKGIEFEFQDHGVSHSIYFQDPDGVELELTTYEV